MYIRVCYIVVHTYVHTYVCLLLHMYIRMHACMYVYGYVRRFVLFCVAGIGGIGKSHLILRGGLMHLTGSVP